MSSETAPAAGITSPPCSAADRSADCATAANSCPVRGSSIAQSRGTTTKSRSCGSRAAAPNHPAMSMLPRRTSESAQPDRATPRATTSSALRRAARQAGRSAPSTAESVIR